MEKNDQQNSMPRVLVEMRALSYQLFKAATFNLRSRKDKQNVAH